MTLQQQEYFQHLHLFHVGYLVATKGKPYTDYVDVIQLGKLHEVNFLRLFL